MSLNRSFPFNPTLLDMSYRDEQLTITFKKKAKHQRRTYSDVPMGVAYGLYKASTASEVLSHYASKIKGQFKVIRVQ